MTKLLKKSFILASIVIVTVLTARTDFSEAQSTPDIELFLAPQTNQLFVGRVLPLTLQIRHPIGSKAIIPRLPLNWGEIEVRGQSQSMTVPNNDGTQTSSQIIEVTLFALGQFETPEFPVTIVDSSGQITRETAPVIAINVVPTITESDTELRAIKSQASIEQSIVLMILGITLLAVIVVGLVGWGVYVLLRRKGWLPWIPKPFVETRSPFEIAIDELSRIESLDLPAQGQFKEQYVLLSAVLRRYLEGSYNLSLVGQTTDELTKSLWNSALSTEDTREVIGFLKDCDAAKFGVADLKSEVENESLTRTRDLIHLITPATVWAGRGV